MVAEYISKMVRRSPPIACSVVNYSTPVVAFGNARTVHLATLGINPSTREFVDPVSGDLLRNAKQRLENLKSLGASDCVSLSDEMLEKVVFACDNYFNANPYTKWFRRLDKIIKFGSETSYFDQTACHLDLSQWATSLVWGNLSPEQRNRLLADGRDHLEAQLVREKISTVVVNGRTVWDALFRGDFCTVREQKEIMLGTSGDLRAFAITAEGLGVRFFGWTCNVQSSRGITNEDCNLLARWLRSSLER